MFIVMKMSEDFPTNHVVATNYELFCDVETMMWLTCVLLMLEAVQSLSKLVSFMILWQLWSWLKLIFTTSMQTLNAIFHMTNSSILWIRWSLNLICCQ